MKTIEYRLEAQDKLSQVRAMLAMIEFKMDQASLRLQHYAESKEALERQVRELERVVERIRRDSEPKAVTESRIERWVRRFGL